MCDRCTELESANKKLESQNKPLQETLDNEIRAHRRELRIIAMNAEIRVQSIINQNNWLVRQLADYRPGPIRTMTLRPVSNIDKKE